VLGDHDEVNGDVAMGARPVVNSWPPKMPRATTVKKPTPSKSDFVRSQPATLSATEVLAKAKAAGLKLTPQLVYKVRGSTKTNGKARTVVAANRTAPPTSGKTTNKSAFVRAHQSLSPKEIVEKAKAAGIKLEVGYVYNVRGAAKMAAKKKRAAAKSAAFSAVTNGGGSRVSTSAENLLRAVAAEIGLGPAIEILQGERGWVHSITKG
jgi:hypothetical protein